MRRVVPTLVLLIALAGTTPASARPGRPPVAPRPWASAPASAVAAATSAIRARAASDRPPCPGDLGRLCGTVEVPLDPSQPAGATVAIHFEVVPHTDTSQPPLAPIFAVGGGPGLSATQSFFGQFLQFVLFAPELDRRDVVLVDYRGTGLSDAIDCDELQSGAAADIYEAVAACGRRLGASSDLYGASVLVEDFEAVRKAVGAQRIAFYGQSYAGLYGQAYALRHPERVEALILDSPVPVTGYAPYFRNNVTASLRAVARVCARSGSCRRDIDHAAVELTALAARLRAQPVRGTAFDAAGDPQDVEVTEATLAKLLQIDDNAQFVAISEIAAAGRALRRGDAVPLLRLAAEFAGPLFEPGDEPPTSFSEGQSTAGYCTDQPLQWDKSAAPAERRRQYDAAVAALSGRLFAPFSKSAWLAPPPEGFSPDPCITWPTGTHDVAPPRPPGATAPGVRTLMLTGDLDVIVAPEDSHRALPLFPGARTVEVAGSGHGTVFFSPCARDMMASFLSTGSPGDVACARRPAVVWPAVGKFPRVAAEADPARVLDAAADASTRADRRVATVVAAAVTDAFRRVFLGGDTDHGRGLRGGGVQGAFSDAGLEADLAGARFAEDVGVTGHASYDFATEAIDADVAVTAPGGPARLRVRGVWFAFGHDATVLTIEGRIGGRRVSLSVPAT